MRKLLIAILIVTIFLSSCKLTENESTVSTQTCKFPQSDFVEIDSKLSAYQKVEETVLGESTEGGHLVGYYEGLTLKKIEADFYGETGKWSTHYYFTNDSCRYVIEKSFTYDIPLTVDSSEPVVISTVEDTFYFNNLRMVRWLDASSKEVAPSSPQFLEKEDSIKNDMAKYANLIETARNAL